MLVLNSRLQWKFSLNYFLELHKLCSEYICIFVYVCLFSIYYNNLQYYNRDPNRQTSIFCGGSSV
jgi:hypothetical protein